MKRLAVFLTPVANEKRLHVALYYAEVAGVARADRFLDAVENTVREISLNPHLGRVYEEDGIAYEGEAVRRISMSPDHGNSTYPYYFIYRILQDSIRVLRIQGTSENDPRLEGD
jgi:plasmid stabilization system protein ParE